MNVFSENWHLVANAQLSLLPKVQVQKQVFRGKNWYVLRDPYNNRFFRIRKEAYQFIIRLTPETTVEQTWQQCLELYPDTAPGQEEVLQLLSQLHLSNLLFFKNRPDSERMFARFKKQQQKELQGKLASFLFIRIPLWDPESWLRKIRPLINVVFSWFGLLLWLGVILLGGKQLADNFDLATSQVQGVLAPDNLFWLFVGMALLKSIHEFGHAMMVKRFGGEVHTMGIMLLVFTPLPYMDATDSWSFQRAWQRALVGAAGMLAELFVAALAAIVWANTGEGTLHSLAFNMILIGSVSSLFFNGNPLLRFDSYYILADILAIPNLYQRSRQQLTYLVETYLFGCKNLIPEAYDGREAFWLTAYGIASSVYRILVVLAIILFVADQWLILGLVMAITSFFVWVLKPIRDVFFYLRNNRRLGQQRKRAAVITIGLIVSLLIFFTGVPMNDDSIAPGIVESEDYQDVYAPIDGIIVAIKAQHGERVKKGQPLIELQNNDLLLDIASSEAQLKENQALLSLVRNQSVADIEPVERRIKVLQQRLKHLYQYKSKLTIVAEQDGMWLSPQLNTLFNSWVKRRELVGNVVDLASFRFVAVASQKQAAELFNIGRLEGDIRLPGQAEQAVELRDLKIIPFEQRILPSAALSWRGGGTIKNCYECTNPLEANEAFFRVEGRLSSSDTLRLYHGVTGNIRFQLPAKTYAEQLYLFIKQLLQKRYRL